MEEVDKLLKTSIGEIERVLNSKTVVGEPITIEGNTLIPLVSIGFGFGAGGGTSKMKSGKADEGTGGGSGGGGGVKPIALIVINKDGVRLEPIRGAASSVVEKVVDVIMSKQAQGKDQRDAG